MSFRRYNQSTAGNIPNTHKFDIHRERESLFECIALCPAFLIVTAVHMVRKRNLLMVVTRYEANFIDPTSLSQKYDRQGLWRLTFQRARVQCRHLLRTRRRKFYRQAHLQKPMRSNIHVRHSNLQFCIRNSYPPV
jgi:hypothetical protein